MKKTGGVCTWSVLASNFRSCSWYFSIKSRETGRSEDEKSIQVDKLFESVKAGERSLKFVECVHEVVAWPTKHILCEVTGYGDEWRTSVTPDKQIKHW